MEIQQKTATMSNTHKIMVPMSPTRHKKFLAFLAAEKVVESIKKGFKELQDSQKNGKSLKSAFDLANEL